MQVFGVGDFRFPKSCSACWAREVDGWDPEEHCQPVCWTRKDGGWAAKIWEFWLTVKTYTDSDGWAVDWGAFSNAIPKQLREDDAERQELIRALRVCANVMNAGAKSAAYRGPDASEDDGD